MRGVGLAWGVELVATGTRAGRRASRAVRDRMRELGVLVGTTGRHGNVLKIRPPLAFDERARAAARRRAAARALYAGGTNRCTEGARRALNSPHPGSRQRPFRRRLGFNGVVISSILSALLAAASVAVYPLPGQSRPPPARRRSASAGPRVGTVVVTGSRSGRHAGRVRVHSDGEGASFIPNRAFTPGERVTVRSRARTYSFRVGRRPPLRAHAPGRALGRRHRSRPALRHAPGSPAAVGRRRAPPARPHAGLDLPRPQGRPRPGRPDDRRRPRPAGLVPAGHRPRGGDRLPRPGLQGPPGADLVAGASDRRRGPRRGRHLQTRTTGR